MRDDGEDWKRMEVEDVAMRFNKATKAKELSHREIGISHKASFTMLALRRQLPDCKLDPRYKSNANRLPLSLCSVGLALKDEDTSKSAGASKAASAGDVASQTIVAESSGLDHHQTGAASSSQSLDAGTILRSLSNLLITWTSCS